jgi:hypothetical protein
MRDKHPIEADLAAAQHATAVGAYRFDEHASGIE